MRTTPEINELAAALAAAQAEMKPAVFNRTNPHFKSRYADLSSINDAADAALNKHGLSFVSVPTMNADGSFSLYSRLLHKSGQWMESEYPITVGSPQSMGSQITYARRYSKSGMTGVVGEEDDDANAAEAAAPKNEATPRNSVTNAVLGVEPLPKAKSRVIYTQLCEEVRAITTHDALNRWWMENTGRIQSMHQEFQRFMLEECRDRRGKIGNGGKDDEGLPDDGLGEDGSAPG